VTDPTTLNVFPFEVNTADNPVLSVRCRTDIREGASGFEHRDALWPVAAIGIEFDAQNWWTLAGARALERFIRSNLGNKIVVPLWTEAVRIAATTSGATIQCGSTSNRLFAATRGVFVWKDEDTYEVKNVTTLNATSIVTTGNLVNTYHAGDVVMPVIVTEPVTRWDVAQWITAHQVGTRMRFNEDPTEAIAMAFNPSETTYQSIPVWPYRCDWSQQLRQSHEARLAMYANATGIIAASVLSGHARAGLEGRVYLDGRSEVAGAMRFFANRRGMSGRFWMPNWKEDFALAADIGSGVTLDVVDSDYALLEAAETGTYARRWLCIRDLANEVLYFRMVTNVQDIGDGVERITVDDALPALDDASTGVGFALLSRFGLDDLSIEMHDADHGTADVRFVECAAEEYEEIVPN